MSGNEVVNKYRKALLLEPENPVINFLLSECYAVKFKNPDSCIYYGLRSTHEAVSWILPYATVGYRLARFGHFDVAKQFLDTGKDLDSTNLYIWQGLAAWYFYQGKYREAIEAFEKALSTDNNNDLVLYNIAAVYFKLEEYTQSEKYLTKSIKLNPNQFHSYLLFGDLFVFEEKYHDAELMYLHAINANPNHLEVRIKLGSVYCEMEQLKKAEMQYLEAIRIDPNLDDVVVWYNLACLSATSGNYEQAITFLENALKNGFDDYDTIATDPDLKVIRKHKSYKTLIETYFPDKR